MIHNTEKCYLLYLLFLFSCINGSKKIITISIPKCGTHLLWRCLELLDVHYTSLAGMVKDESLMVGQHTFATSKAIKLLRECNKKAIFIYRDPRAYAVSFVFHIKKRPETTFALLPLQEMLYKVITNYTFLYNRKNWCYPILINMNIEDFYNLFLPWKNQPCVYSTTFEKLIGPKGGGCLQIQIQEIINIANHIGKPIDYDNAKKIAYDLFGNYSDYFREGKIDDWKKYLIGDNKQIFKKIAGNLLIRLGYEKDLNW